MKPIKLDLPYPSPDCLKPDKCAAAQVAKAYATTESEYTAISQYIFHHFNFYCMGMSEYADALQEIAMAEMVHLDLLGKTLMRLGVSPVFTANPPKTCNFFCTSHVKYSTDPVRMLMDDIASEMDAIKLYKNIICSINNETVCAIIQRIIMDEQLHIEVFTGMLEKLSCTKS